MATTENEGIDAAGSAAAMPRDHSSTSMPRRAISRIAAEHRQGSRSLINLSLYAAGLSGLWTALGTPILPIKVDDILADGGSTILGFTFNEDDKNGALGIVSLVGLAIAALTQPIAGFMSDRRAGPGKRMPFLLIGAGGMAAAVLFLGFAGTLIALILLNLVIQGMGNFGQGAANGLIADHVDPNNKGAAAGALNLSRVIGAGLLTAVVLFMMGQYDADTSPGWLTASLALIAAAAIGSTLWTVTAIWRRPDVAPSTEVHTAADQAVPAAPALPDEEAEPAGLQALLPHDDYLRFLLALTVVITGFSAMQLYSFFYLEDVVGLENPAQGALVILVSIVITTGLSVMPAGRLTDRIGRDPMLVFGGALGVMATIILIFAGSLWQVAIVGSMMGIVIGIFLTVSWALANDLVSKRHAARDLGFASVAVLIGSAISRISGIGVDRLNQLQDGLGYQVVLSAVALCFVIAVATMTRLHATRPVPSDLLPEQQLAD